MIAPNRVAIFPYDDRLNPVTPARQEKWLIQLWKWRTCLAKSIMFGSRTKVDSGLNWFEFGRLTATKVNRERTIAFAEIERTTASFSMNPSAIQSIGKLDTA